MTFYEFGGFRFGRSACLGAACIALSSHAVSAPDPDGLERFELPPLLVTASAMPKNADDYTTLASALTRAEGLESGASNLGESLAALSGVQQTGFAPGAGRPVIRGFSGSRVQILQDGMRVADVSAVSDDHAVTDSAVFARRVEVLRGPSTLLYGGNAIGGVVNVIDETAPLMQATFPASAETAWRYDGGSDGWLGGARATVGNERFVVRATGLRQDFGDYRLPRSYAREEAEEHHEHEDEHSASRLEDSFVERDVLGLGISGFFGNGARISLFGNYTTSLYGVPGHSHPEAEEEHHHDEHEDEAEDRVHIDLQSRRVGAALDLPLDHPFLLRSRVTVNFTDYRHQEFEGIEAGTRFERELFELRNEWTHGAMGLFDGVFGTQLTLDAARAEGDEALTPPTDTAHVGLFWLLDQQSRDGPVRWQHGARLDYQEVLADGDPADYAGWAFSASSGARWHWTEADSLNFQLSLSQRHPSSTELYAEGPHLAMGRYEMGDASFEIETAVGLDLTYRKQLEHLDLTVVGYGYRFFDYLHSQPIGSEMEGLPVFRYHQDDALIGGIEIEATWHLLEGADTRAHVTLGADWVRMTALEDDSALPRNPPARTRVALHLEHKRASADWVIRHVFEQSYIAPFETVTGSYTMLDLVLSWRLQVAAGDGRIFLRGENLTDEVGFSHLTTRKTDKPLPGRNFSAGVYFAF